MISIYDLQNLIGNDFFDGNGDIAGLVIFAVVLIVIFALSKRSTMYALLISLPVTLIFSMLGILSTDFLILMIVVVVLALAYTARNAWRS